MRGGARDGAGRPNIGKKAKRAVILVRVPQALRDKLDKAARTASEVTEYGAAPSLSREVNKRLLMSFKGKR
jgi:hypothetical protein